MNARQEMVLRLRNVEMERFKRWAEENLCQNDEVVLKSSTNTWDIYDTVSPFSEAGGRRQSSRGKTDCECAGQDRQPGCSPFAAITHCRHDPGGLGAAGGSARITGADLLPLALGENGHSHPESDAQSFASSQYSKPPAGRSIPAKTENGGSTCS